MLHAHVRRLCARRATGHTDNDIIDIPTIIRTPVCEAHTRVLAVHHFHVVVKEPRECLCVLLVQDCLAEESCPVHQERRSESQ